MAVGLGAAATAAIVLAVVLIPSGDAGDPDAADGKQHARATKPDVDLYLGVGPTRGDSDALDASDLALNVGLTGSF